MFNIEQYDEIIIHLKSISSVFKKESSGWYSIFCPYCDDAVRKLNPKHGHFHLAPSYPYGHCFRCGIKVGLDKLLIDTKFQNVQIIKSLQARTGFIHNSLWSFQIFCRIFQGTRRSVGIPAFWPDHGANTLLDDDRWRIHPDACAPKVLEDGQGGFRFRRITKNSGGLKIILFRIPV